MLETEVRVTIELAAEHGLTADEYARVLTILGREPNLTELGVFSVMWSEHCSYKSSRAHLRRLPTQGPQVVQGPGENAGVVDIGDGLVATFKLESHNHPSYVEPFQGAATGVGGILRDIFTMGARPIAVLDSLRFGPIAPEPGTDAATAARNRRLLDGVVRGIAFYGNCFGVPTVGGEVGFDASYSGNPLVNVLALGVAKKEDLFFARATGEGNPVLYVGAKTGRDGIHGASLLASAEFNEASEEKRPNVQVGDPFLEKLLLEACLEAMQTGAIVAIQDMGAAGLTSSSCEMASRGAVGIEMNLDLVPQRETGMSAYDMLLSESQERMLLVAARGREQEVLAVFAKWGLDAVEIGRVTDDGILRVLHRGHVVAEIPAQALADEAPVYQRPIAAPARPAADGSVDVTVHVPLAAAGSDLTRNFLRVLASPNVASKRWIFEQYDYMVRTNTLEGPGAGDAAVLRVKPTRRGLALAVDGNGRWSRLDPRMGAKAAVAEAARNVACSGARPWAATNCLNFGNPEKPEVMWQFSEAIDGIAEACVALEIPITGGNVSFYNDTLGRSIDPTPVLGVLGVIDDSAHALGMAFLAEGDAVILLDGLGEIGSPTAGNADCFTSSEYANTIHGIVGGMPPAVDLAGEKRLIRLLEAAVREEAIVSAHDVSDGGLAIALAECCTASEHFSVEAQIEAAEPAEYAGFGERGARAVVSCDRGRVAQLRALASEYGVRIEEIGQVGRGAFRLTCGETIVVSAAMDTVRDAWGGTIKRLIEG
ncbi:MAG: phosphoribosylformylglycinamidine synthase subunit PurL [Candidatus Acidiferrales bacterium]